MAFQDFDQISERRRLERKQKLRQKIIIGVVLTILLISGAVAAYLIFLNSSQPDDTTDDGGDNIETNPDFDKPKKDNSSGASNDKGNDDQKLLQTQKAVQTICQTTDYKETCESRLEQSLSSKLSGLPSSDDLMQAAISAASDELDNAIKQTSTFMEVESAPEKQKPTFDVCKQVLEGAQNDFNHSRNAAGSTDLGNWLSGVMSYQQTCIDAVTENATKTSIEKALKITKELTSNSLAIASSLQKVVSPPTATHRRLLTGRPALPAWMTLDTRRLLKTDATSLAPNVTVAKDGKGDFETITKALESMPDKYEGRYVIHIKKGVYEENVVITKDMANITMYGDGSQKTIVTGDKNFADGVPTFLTATFAAIGEGFMAQSIGFRNTAGPEKHQAVALRVQSDRSVFLNCRMEGYQQTLYVQTHRQFYRGSYIMGTVDFIFGDAAAVFQTCEIIIRKPMKGQQNTVTAQGRVDKHETTGIVLQKCKISADESLGKKSKIESYLGRPGKEYSRTIVMESEIDDVIEPTGWLAGEGDFGIETVYYAEYNNIGEGSRVKDRVKWGGYQKEFKKEDAMKYTAGQFIQGESWLKSTGVPVRLGSYS
ncbi:putative pectinesterase/pectinesterase inhibitor 13 [Bidens hawaiensis]|uniref:putative pectinesterase/pectinesterase inhibitor 13 n=1 Tax=Bidens hawaiensis TaxID=980011 RepID=UPI00404A85ED